MTSCGSWTAHAAPSSIPTPTRWLSSSLRCMGSELDALREVYDRHVPKYPHERWWARRTADRAVRRTPVRGRCRRTPPRPNTAAWAGRSTPRASSWQPRRGTSPGSRRGRPDQGRRGGAGLPALRARQQPDLRARPTPGRHPGCMRRPGSSPVSPSPTSHRLDEEAVGRAGQDGEGPGARAPTLTVGGV